MDQLVGNTYPYNMGCFIRFDRDIINCDRNYKFLARLVPQAPLSLSAPGSDLWVCALSNHISVKEWSCSQGPNLQGEHFPIDSQRELQCFPHQTGHLETLPVLVHTDPRGKKPAHNIHLRFKLMGILSTVQERQTSIVHTPWTRFI